MRYILLGTAVSAGLLAAGAASAATIDFTDNGSYTFSQAAISGSANGIGYTLTPTPSNGKLTRVSSDAPGAGRFAPLVGDNDGIGIDDDEVSAPLQALTLTFNSAVKITALYFLDLFQNPDNQNSESVIVTAGGMTSTYAAQVPFQDMFGYGAFTGLSLTGTSFLFTPSNGNDGQENPDFSLAGLDVAPVPLPAGIWLLGGALGGFGAMRRRARKAAAA